MLSFRRKVAQGFYGNTSILPDDAEGGCVFLGDIPVGTQQAHCDKH